MTSINGIARIFQIRSVCPPDLASFHVLRSFLGGGRDVLIQQVGIEHRLYSSPVLGVVRDTAVNQTDTAPALMEPSQVHVQETPT